jgi:hypothetical protein
MAVSKTESVAVRDYVLGDYNFIISTWIKGLKYGNEWFNLIEQKAYFENYHKVIEKYLANPGASIRVACLKSDPEVILGYSVTHSDNTVLDWVFVKSAWRGIGIAKSLVPTTAKKVTHVTKVGVSILKKQPGLEFNPFA